MAQLLSNLPIGSKVKLGKYQVGSETPWDISWIIVAKSHNGYPVNSITLLAEKCIDYRAFDGKEPTNGATERRTEGNNKYAVSNIDQWLNSSSAVWYTSRHSADTPPSGANITSGFSALAYDNRVGFLNLFSNHERQALLNTTIRVALTSVDGGNYEDVLRKVFLPSGTEIMNEVGLLKEGNQFEWFTINKTYTAPLFPQTYENTLNDRKPSSSPDGFTSWCTRSVYGSSLTRVSTITYFGEMNNVEACNPLVAIRPALNLSSTTKVSDTTDSDGCYTFIWNAAPVAPTELYAPTTIYGGKTNAISWNKATDPDGDTLTYQLECSVNKGEFTQIYKGTATTYGHLVAFGSSTVQYRVIAIDPSGASSEYKYTNTLNVVNNNAPVISGSDSNLGVKSEGFTGTYKVTDANNNTVTVTESIDGVQIRSLVATLGTDITYGITGTTWLALPNGSHTLTIRATDGIDSTVRTYTFTKLVTSFAIRNETPWASDTMPTRIMVVVTRNIPVGATFKVEVCNNYFDTNKVWEDATDAVLSGLVHVFSNKVKTAGQWGVVVRVTVNRNGATGACYVSAIGGNFE